MKQRILFAALALGVALPAVAADWTLVVKDRARRIEIDRDSILQSDPGTKVAWGRIVLSDEDAGAAGYGSVKALNRYDCRGRNFSTIKRVYLDGASRVIREERVVEQRPIQVAPRSVDERLWREVCKPPSASDLARLADEAGRVAAASGAEPGVRHADMKGDAHDGAETLRTADAHEAPPADAHAAGEVDVTYGKIELPGKPHISPRPAPPAPKPAPVAATPDAPEPVVRKAAAPKPAAHTPVKRAAPKPKTHIVKTAMRAESKQPSPVEAHKEIHWGYEGAGAPPLWGKLNPAWKTCEEGKRQSPIDIRDGIRVDLEPIRFDYVPSYFRIIDNGHTVKVSVGPGSRITVMNRTFDLVQFHFHRPSEERVNGRGFDMVAHLVHKDLDGRLAVVAVLIERGEAHPLVQTLWNHLPLEKHHDYTPDVAIDVGALLPLERTYYTYMGSLTTPPCSEDVMWMVMKQPITLSAEQIAIFSRLYPMNARPVQPANDRLIKASR